MARNLLHKTKIEDFKRWLNLREIPHRPGNGEWQILQVCVYGAWHVLYERAKMPEHVTVPRPLEGLVRHYIKDRKDD